jgi:RNA polymerase sigma-70 factor (ECF subfamily)
MAELPPLFARILSNATMDWFRRQKVRQATVQYVYELDPGTEDGGFDLLEALQAVESGWVAQEPAERLSREQTLALIDFEVSALPARQREAFLLRYWEELDTAETALVMGCSEGSVKTHCSRAVHALATALAAKGLKP